MTPHDAIKSLEGREYRDEEPHPGFFKTMGENRLVAVYGASDDLMEFSGAIHDEIGAYNGGIAYITSSGLLENECEDSECPHYEKLKKSATTIKAIWHDGGESSWTYETDIPHCAFRVYEDGEVYCFGIVFSLDEIPTTP